jgi:hypothetical protein
MAAEIAFAQLEELARNSARAAKNSGLPLQRMERLVKRERVIKSGWFTKTTEIIEVPDGLPIVVGWKLYQHPMQVEENRYATDYGTRTESKREIRHVWLHEDGRLVVVCEEERYKDWGPPYHLGSEIHAPCKMTHEIALEESASGTLQEWGREETLAGVITTERWRPRPGASRDFGSILGALERLQRAT